MDGEDCRYSTGKFGKIFMIQSPKSPVYTFPKTSQNFLEDKESNHDFASW